jgi:hypothetical protein
MAACRARAKPVVPDTDELPSDSNNDEVRASLPDAVGNTVKPDANTIR